MKRSLILNVFSIAAVIGLLAVYRLLPHPWNFTPVVATAIFGGLYLNRGLGMILPVAAMFVADLFIDLDWMMTPTVYACILLASWLGQRVGRTQVSGLRYAAYVGGASLTSSVVFFLMTNFVVWASSGMYPMTGGGLVTCYVMAIPFFGNTIVGDLMFSFVLVGAYEGLSRWTARIPAETMG